MAGLYSSGPYHLCRQPSYLFSHNCLTNPYNHRLPRRHGGLRLIVTNFRLEALRPTISRSLPLSALYSITPNPAFVKPNQYLNLFHLPSVHTCTLGKWNRSSCLLPCRTYGFEPEASFKYVKYSLSVVRIIVVSLSMVFL